MERGPLRVNFQEWALEINIDPARKVWKRYGWNSPLIRKGRE